MVDNFDYSFYYDKYADLQRAGLKTPEQLFKHFSDYGSNEKRDSQFIGFDASFYIEFYADLKALKFTGMLAPIILKMDNVRVET